jgi:MATE family multidrug resistance protein
MQSTETTEPETSLWARPAGWRDILTIAFPLVLSTGSWTVQHFVDRMFLAWYDPAAMAAALPAGMLAFTIICLCMGTAGYVNVFVAQYHGAGQPHRVGTALWQSIWFALGAAALLPLTGLAAGPLFAWGGHTPELQALEAPYFRIQMVGAGATVLTAALTGLFTGLGRNWPLMWVNVLITAVNLLLDYALIFGHWGLPEWGIAGAAWATVIANTAGMLVYVGLIFLGRNAREFGMRAAWRLDRALFARLLRYGVPSGMQFTLDILAFTIFTVLVGRIGEVELTASNVAFQVNMLAFLPMIGFGIATQTVVGQWLGRERPELAARAAWSAFHLTFVYTAAIAAFYVLTPDLFIRPFAARADAAAFAVIRPLAARILIFVAVYCLFDTMTIVFSSALKGAGDTRFVMLFAFAAGWTVMVVPTWLAVTYYDAGIFTAWIFLTLNVSLMGLGFLARFLGGKWRSMRVIESPTPTPLPPMLPDVPESGIQ